MLSRIAGLKVLWTTSLLLMLLVLVLGLNLCVAQSNGDIRVQFSPSSYEFIANESIDVQIVVQEYKSGRWSDVALKSYGFDDSDISVTAGTLGACRYGDDAFRESISRHPTFIQNWYVNNYAKQAYIRLTSPSSGSGNIGLTVRANAFNRGNPTAAFTPDYTFIDRDLEVTAIRKQRGGPYAPGQGLFANDRTNHILRFSVVDTSNNKFVLLNNLDADDFEIEVVDTLADRNEIGSIKIRSLIYIPAHRTIGRSGVVWHSAEYNLVVSPPRNTTQNHGRILISLKEGAITGLANDDFPELIFAFTYGTIVAKVDFFVFLPKDYYRNGAGSNPDPDLKDLDGESVILGLRWDRWVTGIGVDDFEVEIDNTDDGTENYLNADHLNLISIPEYPEDFPFEPVPDGAAPDCEFKLLIPDSGAGRIRVYVKENAVDEGNAKTQLSIFDGAKRRDYLTYGP